MAKRPIVLASCVVITAGLALTRPSGGPLGEKLEQTEGAKRISPDWLTVDKENRKVGLYIVAALIPENSGLNFNGYAKGNMTIAVPLDWLVEVRFANRDGSFPHSVGIVEIEDKIPVSGNPAKVALPRAFSLQFVKGLYGAKEDKFEFKANRAGRFWLFCGVAGHAIGGMWDYFVVSEEISEPYVEVVESS